MYPAEINSFDFISYDSARLLECIELTCSNIPHLFERLDSGVKKRINEINFCVMLSDVL